MPFIFDILPTSGQTVFFDWISIIFLAIIVIGLIIGAYRGFLLTLLSIAGIAVSFLLAFFLAEPIANAIAGTGLGDSMITSIDGWLCGNETVGPIFQMVLNKSQASAQLETALTEAGLPTAIIPTVIDQILPLIPEVSMDVRLGLYVAQGITKISLIAISFIVIFLVSTLIFSILKIFARKLNKAKGIGWINRVLGAVFSLAISFVVINLVCYSFTFLTGIPAANDFLVGQLRLNDPTMWSIGKMLYEENFIGKLLDLYLKPAAETTAALFAIL